MCVCSRGRCVYSGGECVLMGEVCVCVRVCSDMGRCVF